MTAHAAVFGSPAFFFTFAVIQAAVLLVGIRYLDYYGRQPFGVVAAVAAWGATFAAAISVAGNAFVKSLLSGDVAVVFGDAISAPLVEETAKGLALLAAVGPVRMVLRRAGISVFEGPGAGLVYGAAVGVGFGFTEDIYYLVDTARAVGFEAGLDTFLYRRDFFGPATLHHAIFTAAFGAGLGMAIWSTSRIRKVLLPVAGFAIAVLMHAVNNGLVEFVLANKYGISQTAAWVQDPSALPVLGDTAGTVRRFMRVIDFWYLAGFLAVIIGWTMRQRTMIRAELEEEVERGNLQSTDLALMFEPSQRLRSDWRLLRTGQLERLRHQRRLRVQLGQLGLLKSRVSRFGGDPEQVNRARREIATLSTYEVVPVALPVPASALIGREDELAAIGVALRDRAAPVVTLLGPGGTGKTRLAIEAASRQRNQFSSGVYFVDLAPLTEPDLVPEAIADVLQLQVAPGQSVVAALGDHLRDKHLLLVLDNFEQVTDAAGTVAEVLRTASRVKILVTSRQLLGISGEHEFPVPPLGLPEAGEGTRADSLRGNAAVALFVERARAVDPGFDLTDANATAVAGTCIALDGLPLAIELAAARVNVLTPAAILDQLGSPAPVLSGGRRDLPARHQALRSTIDWSYDMLTAAEQTLFKRLGVFVDGAGLAAVQAVCPSDDTLDGLSSLRDKSLLRRADGTGDEPRFAMLQTIREYAAERLEADGERAQARERHARYFTGLAEHAGPHLTGADQATWVARLGREIGNLRAVLQWSQESAQLELGMRTVAAVPRFWSMHGLTDPAHWLSAALASGASVPPAVRAKALFADGYAALDHGDLARAETRFEASAAAYRGLDDAHGTATSLAQLAFLLTSRGELDRATALADESATTARRLGDANLESLALSTLADGAARGRDFDRARDLYEQSLALRRQAGDRRNIANALLDLGRVALVSGDHAGARTLLDEGLASAREVADSWSISVGLASLGRLDLAEGRQQDGTALLGQALDLAVDRGGQRLAVECLTALAVAGVTDDARRSGLLLGAAESLRQDIGVTLSPVEVSDTREAVDEVHAALGDQQFTTAWNAGLALGLREVAALTRSAPVVRQELLTHRHARKIAEVLLDAISATSSTKLAFVGKPVEFDGGWLFDYEPAGGAADHAVSTGPIAVFATGRVEIQEAGARADASRARLAGRD